MSSLGIALLIHDVDACGGMERQASLLAARLGARGHRVLVLSRSNLELSPRALLPLTRQQRVSFEVQPVPVPRSVPEGVAEELALFHTLLGLRRWGPVDIVYAVQIAFSRQAQDLGRLLGVPWVVKLAGGGVQGDLAATARLGLGPRLEALRQADRVVCLSGQIEAEALAVGVQRARLTRIPNGVDLALAATISPGPEFLGLEPMAVPLLFVGRLDEGKRVDVLLRALASLLPSRPRVVLLIAGTGPMEGELRRLCGELGLTQSVRFLGQRDDVPRLLKLANVLILPSISEGMSNVILEALAAGTPVIASAIPANEEVLGAGAAGLFPVDDPHALTAALEELLASPEEVARRVARGRRLAGERFDIERVVDAYERLFQSLRQEAPKGRHGLAVARERTRHTRAWVLDRAAAWADNRRRTVSEAVVALKRQIGWRSGGAGEPGTHRRSPGT